MKNFQKRTFVIFDVETTGLSAKFGDRIVEIGALKVQDLKPVEKFHALVDPERPIYYGAFEVNRITTQMLSNAPRISQVLPDFLDFLGEATLVGHNIQFDINFLYNEINLCQLSFDREFDRVDTIRLARVLLPQLGRYPLWRVADALGIQENQKHRAMADVEMTFEVFKRLIRLAQEKNRMEELSL